MTSARWTAAARVTTRRPAARRLRLDPLDERIVPTAEIEPNNTLAQANAFTAASDTLTGSVGSATDVDFFRTNLNQGDTFTVRVDTRDDNDLGIAPAAEVLNPQGQVIGRSVDGRLITVTAPVAGSYYVRLFAGQVFGDFTGSYDVGTSTTAFNGLTEAEPNDTTAGAGAPGTFATFRGAVGSATDVDFYSFSGTAGRTVAIKFANRPAANPAVRLFNPDGTQLAARPDGLGVQATLPTTGTYYFALQGDNSAGAVTGQYVGNINVVTSPVLDPEPGNTLTGATPWAVTTTTSRAAGTLSSLTDIDVFAVTLSSPGAYRFQPESPALGVSTQNRSIKIYNEFGQLVRYSVNNGTAWSGTGTSAPSDLRRRYFVSVQATNETGLGPYVLTGRVTSAFPTQRDVPLYFHDYTGQTTHLGKGPAAPYTPAAVPQAVGLFEARYDIYDVDVTQTNPGSGVEYGGIGVGEFSDHNGGGLGSGSWGNRRVSGDSLADTTGVSASFALYGAAGLINHELGHVTAMPHARQPISFMGYDRQTSLNPVGSFFTFPWTDQRVPTEFAFNQRDHLDFVLQAGRIGPEAEPNNTPAAAQDLNPWLAEMTADGAPRNDRVTVLGRIDGAADVDSYKVTVAANETWAIDIDAAEFQRPLNATLTVLNSGGTVVAASVDALDRDSGLFSADPYLVHQFPTAGTYTIQVAGQSGSVGDYRLKVTPARAFDTAGPRVQATSPDGGAGQDATRQVTVFFNDQIDPATLTPANVVVSGAAGGVRPGTAVFDPIDSALVWLADAPLPADTYTVTLKSGPGGIKDLRGNPLDGETAGSWDWPDQSGNGSPGGDFSFSFTVTGADTSAASVTSTTYAGHPSNRGRFTVFFNDDLDVQSVLAAGVRVRGTGGDGTFDTADDTFTPADVHYDKMRNSAPTHRIYVYTRGTPEAGSYRLEGAFKDAAGNTVTLSQTTLVSASDLAHGPVVADLSVQPNAAVGTGVANLVVTFGNDVQASTLTPSAVRLRYSPDPTFFDANDTFVADADGAIGWNAPTRRATFQPAAALAPGHYLLELDGDPGGITDPAGRLLDGEFLDSNIAGNTQPWFWKDAPSGNGIPGGDYVAYFQVADLSGGVNDAPILDNSGNMTLTPILEDQAAGTGTLVTDLIASAGGDRITDPDAGALEGIAVVAADIANGAWQFSVNNGGSWADLGAVSGPAARLLNSDTGTRVRFVPNADYFGTLATALTFRAWDRTTGANGGLGDTTFNGGTTPFSTATETAALIVVGVNDAPTFTRGPDVSAAEDAGVQTVPNWATHISPGPANESGQALTFVLSTDNDALFAALPAVSPTGTLTFTSAANAFGTATVTVLLRDDGGTADGGVDTSPAQTFTLTVTPVNDAPTITGLAPALTAVLEDATSPPGQRVDTFLSSADPDPSPLKGIAVVGTGGIAGTWQYSTNAGGTWQSFGAAGPAAARLLGPAHLVRFVPAPDANGTATLTYRAWDQTTGTAGGTADLSGPGATGGATAFSATTQTGSLAVTPVNDAPSFTRGADQAVTEDAGPRTVTGWATNLSKGPPDEGGQALTFQVTANTNPGLFSTAPAVSPAGTLTFTPAANANGSATVTVRVKDDGGTANGGVDVSPTQTFTLTVTPVNDPPSFTKGDNVRILQENPLPQSITAWARNISPGPADEAGQAVSFEVTGNTDPSLFLVPPAVSPAGTLTFTPAAGVHGYATITVRARDDGGTADGGVDVSPAQTFWIGVNPVNQAPTFAAGPNPTTAEDAGPQTLPGWATGISAGSPFEADQALTFEVVSNRNPDLFKAGPEVTPGGTLTFESAPDASGTAVIELRLRDNGGTLFGGQDTSPTQTFTITVVPVNDAPSFTPGPDQSVREDAGPQTVPGWATGASTGPPDEAGQAISYEVVGNTNPGLFAAGPAVAPDGTLTYTPAADAVGTAAVTVRARDDGGTADGGVDVSGLYVFGVTVRPVNDAPTFAAGADVSVPEDAGPQALPGWATAVAAGPPNEAGQSVTFLVAADDPSLFAAGPAVAPDGTLTFTPAANAFGSATVTVRLRDNGGTAEGGTDTSAPQTFTLTVRPVNDAPAFAAGPSRAVDEDAGPQAVPGWATGLTAGPPDEAGQALAFEVVGNTNPALFAAGPAVSPTGTLTYTPAPDAHGSATITLRVRDDGGTADGGVDVSPTQTFALTVRPVNDAPVAGPDSAATAVGRSVSVNVLANDADVDGDLLRVASFTNPARGTVRRQGNLLVYTPRLLTGGPDAFRYTIADGRGGTATTTVSITVTDPIAPTVQAVRVYYGTGRYADLAALPRAVLPWERINRVSVVFSEAVTVQPDALTLAGVAGGYGLTFQYNAATRTATWTPAAPITRDRLTLRLAGDKVVDLAGNAMAADWAKSFGLLAGDYDGDGLVSAADLTAIRRKAGTADRFADVNGDGRVTLTDYNAAKANLGLGLP